MIAYLIATVLYAQTCLRCEPIDCPTSAVEEPAPQPQNAPPQPPVVEPIPEPAPAPSVPVAGCPVGEATHDVLSEADLLAVPWGTLPRGSVVRLHHREEPYHGKVLLSQDGVTLCGVAGPGGELPVLDGSGSTTSPLDDWLSYRPLQSLGVVMISRGASDPWGYGPSNVRVEGLDIRGTYGASYYNSDGVETAYDPGAACVYVHEGASVTIQGNVLHDCGQGVFAMSQDDGGLTRDIALLDNEIYGNGVVGSYRHHNVYVQALGATYERNIMGRLRPGSLGGNLKDRSSGTVIRGNRITGGARVIDLVEAQEHWRAALASPLYGSALVEGNVLTVGPGDARYIVHYGGDTQPYADYAHLFRKGTLRFVGNTVVVDHSSADSWRTTVLDISTSDEQVDASGNTIDVRGTAQVQLFFVAVDLATNDGREPVACSTTNTVLGDELAGLVPEGCVQ